MSELVDNDEPLPMPEMQRLLSEPSVFDRKPERIDLEKALRDHWKALDAANPDEDDSVKARAHRRFELSLLQKLFDRVAALEAELGARR